ncbi:MAG: peptide chain release factor 3 [Capsulimonadales bacterium]|nr:peptide chain release factor 3 [Capsulimonadales bacterium]
MTTTAPASTDSKLTEQQYEVRRRRTFAIISHPDAGKTTLTEKLLLYGGAIQMAGAVHAKKNRRQATSDWMELEKQRGISITSTVLQFPYSGHVLNLLDTPGHQDFSEDTYRTLVAADSALMLIDNAKGVEPQTKKLFHVCRQRGIPIFTFVNKMDRPGKDPLELMTELEDVLGIRSVPVVWPIGDGDLFRGVYDRLNRQLHLFERGDGSTASRTVETDLTGEAVDSLLGKAAADKLREDLELLDVAGEPLVPEKVLMGEITPMFFGSAMTNFGVELLLSKFIEMSPPPMPRLSEKGDVFPEESEFRGFVFKIQANMDPNHRDRIAFLRVVSGRFEKDMTAFNARSNKSIRLTRPQKLFAAERETVEEAYPGDIIGLTNPGAFQLGDTVCTGPALRFQGFPRFAPEHFAVLRNRKTEKYKQFQKGIQQLSEEGVVQLFHERNAARTEPILGVVGQLQFEVIQFRLLSEYGVETHLDRTPYSFARWATGTPEAIQNAFWGSGTRRVEDDDGHLVVLFESEWGMNYLI